MLFTEQELKQIAEVQRTIIAIIPHSQADLEKTIWIGVSQICKKKWKNRPQGMSVIRFIEKNYSVRERYAPYFCLKNLNSIDSELVQAFENQVGHAKRTGNDDLLRSLELLVPWHRRGPNKKRSQPNPQP